MINKMTTKTAPITILGLKETVLLSYIKTAHEFIYEANFTTDPLDSEEVNEAKLDKLTDMTQTPKWYNTFGAHNLKVFVDVILPNLSEPDFSYYPDGWVEGSEEHRILSSLKGKEAVEEFIISGAYKCIQSLEQLNHSVEYWEDKYIESAKEVDGDLNGFEDSYSAQFSTDDYKYMEVLDYHVLPCSGAVATGDGDVYFRDFDPAPDFGYEEDIQPLNFGDFLKYSSDRGCFVNLATGKDTNWEGEEI